MQPRVKRASNGIVDQWLPFAVRRTFKPSRKIGAGALVSLRNATSPLLRMGVLLGWDATHSSSNGDTVPSLFIITVKARTFSERCAREKIDDLLLQSHTHHDGEEK